MLDSMASAEADIEPELKLPDLEPMLDAELNTIAEPIELEDVFGSIHDEVCYINPVKPRDHRDIFKKLLEAAALDRADIVKGRGPVIDKTKIDPTKHVRFNEG